MLIDDITIKVKAGIYMTTTLFGVVLGLVARNMFDFLKGFISKESPLSEWIGVAGTLILGILALSGDQIRKWKFRPKLMPVEPVTTKQQIGADYFVYQRLIVKNIGSRGAKEARVLLTYEQKPPSDFIPVPLAWTHWKQVGRDISRNEPAYIDILRKKEGVDKYDFCWPLETGTPYEEVLTKFNPSYGDIRLEFYERDRKIGDITLQFLVDKDILKIKSYIS